MGFFSWKSCDDKRSIPNNFSGKPMKPVYLLQPNGLPSIQEIMYEGYGRFNGIDAYEWLAQMNFGDASLRNVAINADCGNYYEDESALYICSMHLKADQLQKVLRNNKKQIIEFYHYESKLPNGLTPNLCVAQKLWEVKTIALKYPIKLSFNPNARYEDHSASLSCEYQGFFYPDEDES